MQSSAAKGAFRAELTVFPHPNSPAITVGISWFFVDLLALSLRYQYGHRDAGAPLPPPFLFREGHAVLLGLSLNYLSYGIDIYR